jgi:quercetin dioxygenase-like cupin family protein
MSRAILLIIALCTLATAQERTPVKCVENSPERRGEEGCTILTSRPMVGPITGPLYWHIDRFDSLDAAKKAAGPNSVAAEAHGGVWLMTVESKSKTHHGGSHVARIGPLVLPPADGYTMNVRSTLLKRGASTPVHTHSGPEVFYIVLGEQCLETQKAGNRLRTRKSFVVPSEQVHRGRVHNSEMRGALTLVLHDSRRPGSSDLADPPPLRSCK